MTLTLNDQELAIVVKGLLELPAKLSMPLLQRIANEQRPQAAAPEAAGPER